MRVRPVFSHYILIPAIAVYCLSVLLGRFHSLRMIKSMLLIFLFAFGINKVQALDEEPKELPPEIKKDLSRIREGKASRVEILKTAEKLLKAKEEEKAMELYSEYTNKKDEEAIHFNHATSLLKANKIKEALPLIQELLNKSNNEDLKNKMRSNLSIALKNQKEEKDQKKQDKEDDKKDNNENKDKDQKDPKDGQKKEDKNNKQDNKKNDKAEKGNESKKDSKDKNGKEKPEDKKEKDKDKEKNKNKDKNKGDEGEKPEEQKPQTLEQKEKEIEQKRRMTKTPGMIKQIMSDDRELQKKLMDTSTKEKGDLKPQKDW
jgi:hypothetical protein